MGKLRPPPNIQWAEQNECRMEGNSNSLNAHRVEKAEISYTWVDLSGIVEVQWDEWSGNGDKWGFGILEWPCWWH